jgi:4-hydroxy-3-methylbut-2-enyl diphosphate reductase
MAGAEAALINGDDEWSDDLVSGHEVVGLTAGASTPGELVDATIDRLAALVTEAVEVTVAREDVHFRLPREVASA